MTSLFVFVAKFTSEFLTALKEPFTLIVKIASPSCPPNLSEKGVSQKRKFYCYPHHRRIIETKR
jgi:hypothetical protein